VPAKVSETELKPVEIPINPASNVNSSAIQNVRVSNRNEGSQKRSSGPVRAIRVRERMTSTGGGSVDRALRPASNSILPPGFDSNRILERRPSGLESNVQLKVIDVFSMLGIDAGYDEFGWTVKSVGANTLAERSGFKTGDIIEAIDGSTTGRDTVFKGGFNGRNFTVLRAGERVAVSLKSK